MTTSTGGAGTPRSHFSSVPGIRTAIGRRDVREQHDREPQDPRELYGFIAQAS
jgi:hypothetical protein